MAEENTGGTSAADAIDMAVGTAVAVALVNDDVTKPVDLTALPPNCLNCGAAVRGRFCIDCGQTTDTHVPTLGEVIGDAITSLFNLDSRLWRTFGALFFAPGRLTQEFLAGRRARYVPPLRLYLVLSVFTFLVMSIDPRDNDGEFGNGLTEEQEEAIENAATDEERDALIAEIVNARVAAATQDVPEVPPGTADAVADTVAEAMAAARTEADADDPDPDLDPGRGIDFSVDDAGELTVSDGVGNRARVGGGFDCEEMDLPVDRGTFVDSAVREACEEGKADDFDSIQDAFLDNIPLLAFMVIPVMAVVFKLFYLFTRRNYLAHLVFLCHTHAFTFLLIVVLTVLRFAGRAVPALYTPFAWMGGGLFLLYTPAYYFLAMRRVYGQGVLLTLLKEFLLMLLYFVVITLVFSVGFLVVMFAT
jgi:hypothetical protein